MGRADSIDLRKRVVAAVETGGLSRLQAAAQFEARRFLWIQRFRRTSNVKPIRMGGYKPRKIAGRLTTTGWCADAGRPTSLARTGRRIGRERPKVDCRVHREKLRHKKGAHRHRAPTSFAGARNGASTAAASIRPGWSSST
jgi:transposase